MKILLADDDSDLVDWLGYAFRRDGYTVVTAYNGAAAVRVFEAEAPDIVVLDLKMPQLSGLEVLREIRRRSQAPVILLSATGEEDTVVQALESGANDYVTKPFRPRELRARVAGILQRDREAAATQPRSMSPLRCGDVTLDPRARTAAISGRPVQLTPNELKVLEYLMLNQGTVMRIPDILVNVWGYDTDQGDQVVRVTVSRLRGKIEPDPSNPRYIRNVPGEGYMLQP